jgi:hypothetical protein
MKHYIVDKFDQKSAYDRLIKLSNSCIWIGIGLIAVFQSGFIFFRSSDIALHNFTFYSLVVASFIGLSCIMFGRCLWRAIYGLFPNATLRCDPAQKRHVKPHRD